MDDYERTTRRVRTEDVVEDPVTTPLMPAQPVYTTAPVDPAQPVYPAQQVYATPPVYPAQQAPMMAAPATGSRDRIVTDREIVIDRPSNLEMARRIIKLGFGILQGLLVLRIVLLLLVANRENDIVQLLLNFTNFFVAPFRDMFAISQIGRTGSVLDIAAIIAIIAWTMIELLLLAILNLGARRSRVEGR